VSAHENTSGAGEAPLAASLRRFRARYGLLLEWVVGALMVILAAEVTIGVVFRTIGHSLSWYDELASVLLAWLTYYGSALASVKRAHIGCPEIVEQMPWGPRRAFGIVAQVLVITFFVLLGWVGAEILPVLHGESLVSLDWVPMSVVQSVIPISSFLIVVAEITHLIDLIIGKEPKQPDRPGAGTALADGLH
jgi:TRAP-type C4-dicarboxylate transport system permease small subunit